MITRRFGFLTSMSCLLSFALFHVPSTGAEMPENKPSNTLAGSYNAFGFDIYAEVLGAHSGENIFVSPASIALALAMTYNGASGATGQAMAATLKIQGMSMQEFNDANRALAGSLRGIDPAVELSIANSLWLREGFPFRRDFILRSQQYFGAEVFNYLNASTINDWVKSKTGEKIEKIIEEVRIEDIAILINAIYFKGIWTREFDREETTEEDFHLPGGRVKKLPMMNQSGEFSYLEGEGFQAVSLAYGGGRLGMYIFLPSEDSSLDKFHKDLDPGSWNKWLAGFSSRQGRISLPRFKVEFKTSLVDPLRELDMGRAFSGSQADFSRMCDLSHGNVFIGDVLHKTFLEVNEEGTEAAAATGAVMRLTAIRVEEKRFRMIVDRPFFLAIRDNDTGLTIFMGSIIDP